MNGCLIKSFLIGAVIAIAIASFSNIKDYTKRSSSEKVQNVKTKATIVKKMIERVSDKKLKEKEAEKKQ